MARVPITVMGYRCERCDHEWLPRQRDNGDTPRICPKCKSAYWDRPRQVKSMTNYEDLETLFSRLLKLLMARLRGLRLELTPSYRRRFLIISGFTDWKKTSG